MTSLKVHKVFIFIFFLYADFAHIFSEDLASKLPEYIETNNHLIDLVENQQLPYKPIHSLKLIELKILKIYIKTNLANNFIKLSKFSINIVILFIEKPNSSF